MKRFLLLTACLVLPALTAVGGPDEEFATVVGSIQRGDQLVQDGKDRPAMEAYRQAQLALLNFKKVYPQWDPQVVSFRMRYLSERLGNWSEPETGKPAPPDAELQALQSRITFLERSSQQYQAQINQLLSENGRLSTRLREALAIRPAGQDPVLVLETQTKLEAATKAVAQLQTKVKELETELTGIPKPEEARQNVKLLEETRKNLNQTAAEAEVLRKQLAELRQEPREVAPSAIAKGSAADQPKTTPLAASSTESELLRLRTENESLRQTLASLAKRSGPGKNGATERAGGSLKPADRARLALAEGQVAEAIGLLEAELAVADGNAEAWYLLGRARLATGAFAKAEAALQRALALAPGLGAAQVELARFHLLQPPADLALARWHYHKAISLGSPRDALLEKEIAWENPPVAK